MLVGCVQHSAKQDRTGRRVCVCVCAYACVYVCAGGGGGGGGSNLLISSNEIKV